MTHMGCGMSQLWTKCWLPLGQQVVTWCAWRLRIPEFWMLTWFRCYSLVASLCGPDVYSQLSTQTLRSVEWRLMKHEHQSGPPIQACTFSLCCQRQKFIPTPSLQLTFLSLSFCFSFPLMSKTFIQYSWHKLLLNYIMTFYKYLSKYLTPFDVHFSNLYI